MKRLHLILVALLALSGCTYHTGRCGYTASSVSYRNSWGYSPVGSTGYSTSGSSSQSYVSAQNTNVQSTYTAGGASNPPQSIPNTVESGGRAGHSVTQVHNVQPNHHRVQEKGNSGNAKGKRDKGDRGQPRTERGGGHQGNPHDSGSERVRRNRGRGHGHVEKNNARGKAPHDDGVPPSRSRAGRHHAQLGAGA